MEREKKINPKQERPPLTLAIQGYEGSFHQMAARLYYGKQVKVFPCASFRELVLQTANKKACDGGVMAIENSIAGSILPNYNLLHNSPLRITGELYLQIRQHLLANPGVALEDIREVHSHTMALQQCFGFLDRYRWKLVETEDTALSARHIYQHKSRHVAAIAGSLAAELYGLQVLSPNIHTLRNNYTRFLMLRHESLVENPEHADKASVSFHTDHSRGSLARVLGVIADGGINLSKLQSFPIPGSHFKYAFHADMEFEDARQFEKVIARVRKNTGSFKVYGVYKRGLWK